MFNYYYKLTAAAIEGTKIESVSYPDGVTLVVKAATPEDAFDLAQSRINMNDWELDRTEDA